MLSLVYSRQSNNFPKYEMVIGIHSAKVSPASSWTVCALYSLVNTHQAYVNGGENWVNLSEQNNLCKLHFIFYFQKKKPFNDISHSSALRSLMMLTHLVVGSKDVWRKPWRWAWWEPGLDEVMSVQPNINRNHL